MSERRSLLTLVSLSLLHAACAPTPAAFHVSAPEAPPAGVAGDVDATGRAVFRLDRLEMALLALDATAMQGGAVPSLLIRFAFKPGVLGYSFDPMRVELKRPDAVLRPKAYVGPGEIFVLRSGGTWETARHCRQHRPQYPRWFDDGEALPARTEARSYPLGPNAACFVLSFATSVEPGDRVDLSIGGIAIGTQSIAIPDVRLSRRAGRSRIFEMRPAALSARARSHQRATRK